MNFTMDAAIPQTDAPSASSAVEPAQASTDLSLTSAFVPAEPIASHDEDAHGWHCWLCSIDEDAPTVELARIRLTAHIALMHGELVDLARRNNDPSAVVPRYSPAGSRPRRTSRSKARPR